MFIGIDGCLLMEGQLFHSSLSRSARVHALSDPGNRQKIFFASDPASWEGKIISFTQRVHEVKDLVREDLHELLPCIDALGAVSTISPEQTAQLAAVTASYEQIYHECEHALDRLLLPLLEPGEQEVCAPQLVERTV